MREDAQISALLKEIEVKMKWGSIESWTNYNFSLLSDEINSATGKRISDSTLKRIFGKKKTQSGFYNPHQYTKNVLAEFAGYQNWEHFRKEQLNNLKLDQVSIDETNLVSQEKKSSWVYVLSIIIILLFFALAIFLVRNTRDSFPEAIEFTLREETGIAPYTAVFDYHFEEDEDTFYIDFGNNESYHLSSRRNMITQFYPGADYARVRVTRNGYLINEERVHILSGGWQAGFSPSDTVKAFKPFEQQEGLISDGRLYIPEDAIKAMGVGLQEAVFIEYRYFDEFSSSLDKIDLQVRLKNNAEEGGKRCYDAEVILKGENDDLVVRFLEPGCFRYARFNVGEKKYFGRFHDLSMFARDVSDWKDIRVSTQNGLARIFFEDEIVRAEPYFERMGELKGIIIRFFGNGSVDYIRLEDETGVVLEDDF